MAEVREQTYEPLKPFWRGIWDDARQNPHLYLRILLVFLMLIALLIWVDARNQTKLDRRIQQTIKAEIQSLESRVKALEDQLRQR